MVKLEQFDDRGGLYTMQTRYAASNPAWPSWSDLCRNWKLNGCAVIKASGD